MELLASFPVSKEVTQANTVHTPHMPAGHTLSVCDRTKRKPSSYTKEAYRALMLRISSFLFISPRLQVRFPVV